MTNNRETLNPRVAHMIIFFVAFSTLMLELLITKVLSFAFWNHVVYFIISLALLGYGISSTFVLIARNRIDSASPSTFISLNLIGFVISTIVALLVVKDIGLVSESIVYYLDVLSNQSIALQSITSAIFLLIAYLLFLIPFFLCGNILIYLFYAHPESSNELYFWDLAGAALGCLAFIPVIIILGAIDGIVLILLLASILSIYLLLNVHKDKKLSFHFVFAIFSLGIVVCVLLYKDDIFKFVPDKNKSLGHAFDSSINSGVINEYSAWDVVSRLDIASNHKSGIDIGWTKIPPPIKLITFDGDAISQIAPAKLDFPRVDEIQAFWDHDLHAPFFVGIKGGNHLIVGLGGGPDIARSLLMQADRITGVDINKAVIDAMQGSLAEYSGNIFNRNNVEIYHSEGRSFIKHSNIKYDLIQMTGVDTFTALSTGAYVLAENYLYTVEAVRDYYNNLSDDGIICIHRWFYDNKPRESLRLFSIMLEALKQENVSNPELHIAVVRGGSGITFLKKTPFTLNDSKKIESMLINRSQNPKIIYFPWLAATGHPASKYYHQIVEAFKSDRLNKFYDEYEFDVRPVTDDKPFFFSYYKARDLLKMPLRILKNTGPIQGYWPYLVFLLILLCASISVAFFIFVPLLIMRREGLKVQNSQYASLYFMALGLAFIMIEIALMQKMALFLGHPMYSITTVLGGMLLFAGIGSFISGRLKLNLIKLLNIALVCVVLMVGCFLIFSPFVIDKFLGHSIYTRITITLLMIAPLSVVLGVFFPIGLRIVSKQAPEFIPWAWGINSGFTVIGSILAIIFAMIWGFSTVLQLSVLIYLVGVLNIRRYAVDADLS